MNIEQAKEEILEIYDDMDEAITIFMMVTTTRMLFFLSKPSKESIEDEARRYKECEKSMRVALKLSFERMIYLKKIIGESTQSDQKMLEDLDRIGTEMDLEDVLKEAGISRAKNG